MERAPKDGQTSDRSAGPPAARLLRLGAAMVASPPAPVEIVPNADNTHKFHTTRRYPIYYLSITKCGSTYMKNLFYALDNDRPHPNPSAIHDHGADLHRADFAPRWMIRRAAHAFSVLRRPSGRFLSLYFDKIYGDHPGNFPELREEIAQEAGLDLSPGLSLEGHRLNAGRLITWIATNLSHETDQPVNPHWRPQMKRIGTVQHMGLNFLTLEGLDWQLPAYLGGAVPGLAKAMAMVKTRNRAAYPVDPKEVLTDELEAEIAAVYPEDQAKWARANRWWSRRRDSFGAPAAVRGGAPGDAPRLSVLTTHRFNLNTLAQPKAGISYLRNLHYALDHGRMHPRPDAIENDGCLLAVARSAEQMADGVNIVVLRDPVARFFSLYFDKVWSEGDSAFGWIAEKLRANRRFRGLCEAQSQAEHHDNCCRLLGYLETRFRERPVEELNPHWRPQIVRVRRAAAFGFQPVMLENFAEQLVQVADGRIRGLERALELTTFRNSSPKPLPAQALASPEILERLHALYGDDIALYERVRAGWLAKGAPPKL